MRGAKAAPQERGVLLVPTLPSDHPTGAKALPALQPSTLQPSPPPPSLPSLPESRDRGRGLRFAGLLILLVGCTIAGLRIGHALEPGQAVATAPTAARPAPAKPPIMKPVAFPFWKPLIVAPVGKPHAIDQGAAIAMVGKRLLVIGGRHSDDVLAGRAGDALTSISKLSTPRAAAAAFTVGGAVLVVGGERGSQPTDEILRVSLTSPHVVAAGRFSEPLAEAGIAAVGGSAYLVGGWTGEKYATAVLRFDPPTQVTLVGRLPDGVRSPAVALLGHRLFVAGGLTQSGRTRQVFTVDTRSGAVKVLGQLPQAVDRALLIVSGSKLYLLGGRSASGKPIDTIVQIDPRTGRISTAGRMPHPLAGAAAVPVGRRTLVVAAASGSVYSIG